MSVAQMQLGDGADQLGKVDHLWHLQRSSLTDGLTLKQLHRLGVACRDLILEKNQAVFHQGDKADALFIVNRGTIRLLVTTANGRQRILGILSTGQVFGEETLHEQGVRQTQAVAHEDAWLSVLSRDSVVRLVREIPSLSFNLVGVLSQRLMDAREEIETLSFSSTELKIARTLVKLSADHGKRILTAEPFRKLKIPMSHEQLAQMIGANRPHVSAIMSEFRRKGFIEYQKRKLLVNDQELRRFINSDEISQV
jgi:CRP-like cAMP-binding protein